MPKILYTSVPLKSWLESSGMSAAESATWNIIAISVNTEISG